MSEPKKKVPHKSFAVDTTDELQRGVKYLIRKFPDDFEPLKLLHFLFLWKLGDPDYDEEKQALYALTKKCPTRERDVYGMDIELRVHQNSWKGL